MSYIPEEDKEREEIDILCPNNIRADYGEELKIEPYERKE